MQVPVVPPAVPSAVLPDQAAKLTSQIHGQTAMPLTQRAIDPSPKSDQGNKSRSNGDRGKGGGKSGSGGGRGGSVNIRV